MPSAMKTQSPNHLTTRECPIILFTEQNAMAPNHSGKVTISLSYLSLTLYINSATSLTPKGGERGDRG